MQQLRTKRHGLHGEAQAVTAGFSGRGRSAVAEGPAVTVAEGGLRGCTSQRSSQETEPQGRRRCRLPGHR